ncbi:MAG: hypothetical protein QF632_04580 [Candidatus Woesearchaeota archaeon]|jgi:hypothetical protein|nr:hypothetical protein [Candidatus Woesearchaeota archaeon]MDP7324008.1 hypothetical protein [Candidatus Woesearchaeota archaeon]MDP7458590.1 hypothetical protein [Candidatus Woesearchaeota archaeon]
MFNIRLKNYKSLVANYFAASVKNHPSQMGGMKGKTTPSFETECVVLEHAQDTTHTISGLA